MQLSDLECYKCATEVCTEINTFVMNFRVNMNEQRALNGTGSLNSSDVFTLHSEIHSIAARSCTSVSDWARGGAHTK